MAKAVCLPPSLFGTLPKTMTGDRSEIFKIKTVSTIQTRERLNIRYSVFPLEGVWRLLDKKIGFSKPENIEGHMMVKQPLELSVDLFTTVKADVLKAEEHDYLAEYIENAELRFRESHNAIQKLHTGPYIEEPSTFKIMNSFAESLGLSGKGEYHREIYLKDVRHALPDAFETIIRMSV
ncbi:MAG: hypothetical protein K2X93_01795 [Candidatus Obscuribacterales bacterium]|nr:hypothetical protein [Candidatus Obscuribacterales bacterium]